MSKLVDMDEFRMEQTAKRAFTGWQERFSDSFTFQTRFTDLSNNSVSLLSQSGEESASLFYEMIMGVLNLGSVLKFDQINAKDRLRVVDTHLYLADILRHEMMRRINWIDTYPLMERSLIDLVETWDGTDYSRYSNPPQLRNDHPRFEEFEARITREKEVMLRQMSPEALELFQERFFE